MPAAESSPAISAHGVSDTGPDPLAGLSEEELERLTAPDAPATDSQQDHAENSHPPADGPAAVIFDESDQPETHIRKAKKKGIKPKKIKNEWTIARDARHNNNLGHAVGLVVPGKGPKKFFRNPKKSR